MIEGKDSPTDAYDAATGSATLRINACMGHKGASRGEEWEESEDVEAPLLTDRSSHSGLSVETPSRLDGPVSRGLIPEAKRLAGMAAPLMAQNTLYVGMGLINTMTVGRLGNDYLAAMLLGTAVYNITGFSMMVGLASGQETLGGQAYGARQYAQVGVVLQRGLLINLLAAAIVAFGLWTHVEPLLLAMGQQPAVAHMATRYLHLCIPALLMHAIDTVTNRYLLVQGVTKPNFLSSFAGTVLIPVYLYYFVFVRGLALDGAAYAYVCAVASILAVNLTIVAVRELWVLRDAPNKCFRGWTLAAVRGWPSYLRYAVPSYMMIAMEWWAFDCLLVISGLLPEPKLAVATFGICLNIASLAYMFPLSFMDACITRVSNELGAGRPAAARTAVAAAVALGLATQTSACVIALATRGQVGQLWSSDPDVIALVAATALPMGLLIISDGYCCILAGVLRGSGQQVLGLALNSCTYWLFGIPFCSLLAFGLGLGVSGLWAGLGVVTFLQGVALTVIVLRMDWRQQAADAAKRVAELDVGDGVLVIDGQHS